MTGPTIRFLGAAGTVTGSRFLVESGSTRILVDCGMFQGRKELRQRNWAEFPVDPASIDAVVVSHAHLDHVGYLPRLVADGFSGSIHATRSTTELSDTVLRDSGRLHEADAERANRRGYTKHRPALPLYTEAHAISAMRRFVPTPYETQTEIAPGIRATFRFAGHILGSASVTIEVDEPRRSVVFSGDLGRPFHPILRPPDPPSAANTILIESTYGDEEHLEEDATADLGAIITATVGNGGSIVIPAFAIDRTELILHALHRLTEAGSIPRVPVFLDSPMARTALGHYVRAIADGDADIRPEIAGHAEILDPGDLTITETVDDSKAINNVREPHIIISASGMATGGRVLHHLKRLLPGKNNTVILVGYQAGGTRGQALLSGADHVRIHGDDVRVAAHVESVPAFSVHADRSELVDWLGSADRPPQQVVAIHGDPEASAALVDAIESSLGWPCSVAAQDATVDI